MLPLFNMAAAAAVVRLHRNRRKGPLWTGLWLLAVALLACSAVAAVLMTAVSRLNYPGGHALACLHAMEAPSAADALSSGDSQRSECNNSWSDYMTLLSQPLADRVAETMRTAAKGDWVSDAGRNLTVHIDTAATMTGVSRFREFGAPWVYSKVLPMTICPGSAHCCCDISVRLLWEVGLRRMYGSVH